MSDDVTFALVSPVASPDELQVKSLRGEEQVNEAYRFQIVARAPVAASRLQEWDGTLPGSRATLRLGPRPVHGLVTAFEVTGPLGRDAFEVRLTLEPRLALLDLNVDHRIWQDLTVAEVAAELLTSWDVDHAVRVEGPHRPRRYLTQRDESDYDFLRRILASEGIFFLFEHPDDGDADAPGRERVIIADVAALTPEIAGGAALRFVGDTDALTAAHAPFDGITRLGRTRRLRPQRVLQGDYDFRRPGLPNLTKAEARDPRAAGVGGSQLRMRPHAAHAEIEDAAPAARFEDARAQWTLEQHRSRRDEASGASTSRRLVPGHRFTVEDHPLEHLNVGYLVRSVVHEGTVAELSDALDVDTYHNTFTFVPEAVAPRPPVWPHPRRAGPETATVVGTEGEAISTDDQGRIRVQFHWDLAERPPDRRSCWIRVAQPWAGTHFGAQFIPRVGDEVVVSFLGGDPDRPLCTGSVYNGTHPTPFDLPDAKATSGFRTQSTPGGEGYNELSFDDAAGEERVYLHAERDLVADVGRNHHVTVTGTQTLVAHGHQALVATLGQSMQVGGAQVVNVLGDHQVSAAGSSLQSVTGDAEVTVGRRRNVVVEGHDRVEVKGAAQAVYGDDHTVRVAGHQTTIVGAHDARRSHTLHVEGSATTHGTGTVRITSDKELELAVGDSVIRLTSDGIELRAPNLRLCGETLATRATDALNLEAPEQITLKSKKVLMESEAAFLGLAKVAKLKGELVKLNCTDDPVDALDPPEAPKRTTIALSDETGAPLSGQRFIVVLADGTETTGTLDDKGEAELVLDQSGEVIFPDVHRPRPA